MCGTARKRRKSNSKWENTNPSQRTLKRTRTFSTGKTTVFRRKTSNLITKHYVFNSISSCPNCPCQWEDVHSPHSKWTSLCLGLPRTLGGRHAPGAMLSVRTGRLSEHCGRNTRENQLSYGNLLDLYIPD